MTAGGERRSATRRLPVARLLVVSRVRQLSAIRADQNEIPAAEGGKIQERPLRP